MHRRMKVSLLGSPLVAAGVLAALATEARAQQPAAPVPVIEGKPEPFPTPEEAAREDRARTFQQLYGPKVIEPKPILAGVPGRDVEGEERAKQLRVGALISRRAEESRYAPAERLQHFAWIKERADRYPPLVGWKGQVEAMAPIPGGHLVRLRVYPVFALSTFGANGCYTDETFAVVGKDVRPVKVEVSPYKIPMGVSY